MKKVLFTLLFLFTLAGVHGQGQAPPNPLTLSYYLPEGVSYDESIPTPEDVLGYQVGEWHVSHDHLVMYMKAVAAASDRISIKEYGRTYENRPLLLLTITSPSNQGKIKEIREEHLKLSDPSQSGSVNTDDMPIVVWLGYSVHGNEPSGANSSLLTAYHLAAAQGAAIEELLENVVVLVDPSFNPDGLNRFASWVNTHKSATMIADPNMRELNEAWPGGRTNHYWFDLNRDWLPTQLPESQGRIKQFQRWKPNILTDHHEMGTNSTFFFQPGIPSRKNPLTPMRNVELTGEIASYHAKALDNIQSLYYSEESFDDFYYGKGSTYPDVQGSVGILFEQASSRGHAQESVHGVVHFPFTIRNQFTVSLSTLEAGRNMRKSMLDYQRQFYKDAEAEAKASNIKGYVFGDKQDPQREIGLIQIMQRHKIKVHKLGADMGKFKSGEAYVVPLEQPQSRLIKAMFRTQKTFNDSLFYDVSSWTLPMAFNLPYQEVTRLSASALGEEVPEGIAMPEGKPIGESQVGYAFSWDRYYAPKALYALQRQGIRAKVANRPFAALVDGKPMQFDYGTIIIPSGIQPMSNDKLKELVAKVAKESGVDMYGMETGLAQSGVDMGSPSFSSLRKPRIAVLAGSGVSSYDAGEVWHLLDQRYEIPVSVVAQEDLRGSSLDRYNVIVMAEGNYSQLSGSTIARLKTWLQDGGVIVAMETATEWVSNQGLSKIKWKKADRMDSLSYRPYAKLSADLGSKRLGGSIFQATLDLTHPMCYGYNNSTMPVFRRGTYFAEKSSNPYATPVRYTQDPVLSGYIKGETLDRGRGTAAVLVSAYGSGKVISMLDNPNFRAFWWGTNKLFANAIFFGHTISGRSAR